MADTELKDPPAEERPIELTNPKTGTPNGGDK